MAEQTPKLSRKIFKRRFSKKEEKPDLGDIHGNKRSEVAEAILKIFEKHNYDPLEELVRLRCMTTVLLDAKTGSPVIDAKTGEPAVVPFLDPKEAVSIDKELLKYLYPQKKSVEVAAKEGSGGVMILNLTETMERLALEDSEKEVEGDAQESA